MVIVKILQIVTIDFLIMLKKKEIVEAEIGLSTYIL